MFCIEGDDSSVSSLVIDRNGGTAVQITGDRASVSNNYIGTDTTGKLARGNSGDGVSIIDAADATVSGNVISANSGHGVSLSGTNCTECLHHQQQDRHRR